MMRIECRNPKAVAEEALWLAWQAATPKREKEDESPPPSKKELVRIATLTGETVGTKRLLGRAMWFQITWDDHGFDADEKTLDPDFQSWCLTYPNYAVLILAAVKNVGGTNMPFLGKK